MNKNEMNSKPRRAQGGMGLLSRTISVQNPQESMTKNPSPREERRGTGKRGAPGSGSGGSVLAPGEKGKERERVRGGEGVFNPNNSQPKRLNYP